jgi:hypothetical protein
MAFASVYPLYLAKVERKGRQKAELDQIICWLTGYDQAGLEGHLAKATDFAGFFAAAPMMNPARVLVTGLICGVRIEAIEEPLMRDIRRLDRLVDELAKGRPMMKILRG